MKGFVGKGCFESQDVVRKISQFSLNEITPLAKVHIFYYVRV